MPGSTLMGHIEAGHVKFPQSDGGLRKLTLVLHPCK